ncbi:unnamed protein product [Rotaria socialis]|uniref:F-box domain-containing protein n=1 Tax=Rotaria socialis TaxID=392032 RepID=A0A821G407_9BILA|nr:unnamed protein product [Rotaria socialis]
MTQLRPTTTIDVSVKNTSLITLPPELVHRLLDYCDIQTLLTCVRHVCKTLYALINTYDRLVLILNSESVKIMRSISRFIQPENVISITIVNDCEENDKINLFHSLFDIARFTRLRSLTIHRIKDTNLEHFLENLSTSSLTSLSIESSEQEHIRTWDLVSSASLRWNLRKLCISNMNFMAKYISWSDQYKLEHLEFSNCTYSDYLLILRHLPNLRTLVIQNCIIDDNQTCLTLSASIVLASLKSLTITNCSLAPQHFELLISSIPSLHHLKLISHRESFVSLESFIASFRAPFWLDDKHWFVTCAYVPRERAIWLHTIPIDSTRYQGCVRCEVSWRDNICRLTQRSLNTMVDNVSDETLTALDLSTNQMRNAGIQHLASILENNTTLTTVNLAINRIGPIGTQYLANVLKNNLTLAELNPHENPIRDLGIEHLADALSYNSTLTTLNLDRTQIENKGAQYLANALSNNRTLITLELARNQITELGVKYIANALSSNRTLATLNLAGNQIGAVGAQHLAKALQNNTTLTKLDICANQIGTTEVQHLANFLHTNTVLTTLNLTGNQIEGQGVQYFANALSNNTTLTTLDLHFNQIGDQGAQHLANVLQNNTTLMTLDIHWNQIGELGAQHLANALRNNSTLDNSWKPSGWLGITLAGAIYIKGSSSGVESLTTAVVERLQMISSDQRSENKSYNCRFVNQFVSI